MTDTSGSLTPRQILADDQFRLVRDDESQNEHEHGDEQLRDELGDAEPERIGVQQLCDVDRGEHRDTVDEPGTQPGDDLDRRGPDRLGRPLERCSFDGFRDA